MTVKIQTENGQIELSNEVIATVVGGAATDNYGVVGMASKQILKDGWAELLKKENYTKGVVVRNGKAGLEIDLYIVVSFGVKISEVVTEAQKKVKYMLEKSLSQEVAQVNVFVQGVRVVA